MHRVSSRLLVFLCLAGCGGAPERAETPGVEAAPSLPPLPELSMLVPDGATTIVLAKPSVLVRAGATRRVIEAVAPPDVVDAFERRTGVIPAELEEVVAAEYEDGFVLFARGPFPAADVVRAAEMRMNTVESRSDVPFVRRSGFIGTDRREVVALDDHVVMVAGGVPDVISAVLARASSGEWPDGRSPALAGGEVAALARDYRGAPLSLFVPQPLSLPEGFGASMLLAGERALAATLVSEDEVTLGVTVELVGEFPEGAEDNFRAMVESMGRSGLGAALGITEAARTLSVQVDDRSVVLRARVSSDALAAGLRVLFLAQLEELLAAPPSAP